MSVAKLSNKTYVTKPSTFRYQFMGRKNNLSIIKIYARTFLLLYAMYENIELNLKLVSSATDNPASLVVHAHFS